MDPKGDFYCRYYVGHKGKFGHEFLEFEFTASGLVCLLSTVRCWQTASTEISLILYADALCKQFQLQKRYYDQEGGASQQNSPG